MNINKGDKVLLHLSPTEAVAGEVVDTDIPDIFSEGWSVLALITEGGHPRYGQVGVFSTNEISVKGESTW